MRGSSREPQPVKEVLKSLLREIRAPEKGPFVRTKEVWEALLGPTAAAKCRLAALENGVLVVEVASSALKHDLSTFRRETLLGALRERVPEAKIRALRFRAANGS
jgi:predicted nucleic acid-binding Zn ribbon protein